MKCLSTMVLAAVLPGLALGGDLIPSDRTVLQVSEALEEEDSGELLIEQSDSDAAVEAEVTADELEELDAVEEYPAITLFEPRVVDGGDIPEGHDMDTVAAEFAVPRECASVAEAALACSWGDLQLTPVVIDDGGEVFTAEVDAESEGLEVRAGEVDSADFPLVVTAYLASPEDAELVPDAIETFAWMMSAGDEGIDDYGDEALFDGYEEPLDSDSSAGVNDDSKESTEAQEAKGQALGVGRNSPTLTNFSVVQASAEWAFSSRPLKVTVPSNYKYCPWTCSPRARHDYCTLSPDRWGRADFRGPCARHDMSISSIAKKKISLASKRNQRAGTDLRFRSNLKQNCAHEYFNSNRLSKCYGRTAIYYAAVSSQTGKWNGK